MMNKENIVYKDRCYPIIELFDFDTADGYNVDYGIFADEDFMDIESDELQYRMLDDRIYGYLPKELIEKGIEEEIREYIKANVG